MSRSSARKALRVTGYIATWVPGCHCSVLAMPSWLCYERLPAHDVPAANAQPGSSQPGMRHSCCEAAASAASVCRSASMKCCCCASLLEPRSRCSTPTTRCMMPSTPSSAPYRMPSSLVGGHVAEDECEEGTWWSPGMPLMPALQTSPSAGPWMGRSPSCPPSTSPGPSCAILKGTERATNWEKCGWACNCVWCGWQGVRKRGGGDHLSAFRV